MEDESSAAEYVEAVQKPYLSPVQQMMQDLMATNPPYNEEDHVRKEDDESPVIRMANAILVSAIDSGASDLHIEPERALLNVRLRIDGTMQPFMQIPKHIQRALADRYKVMTDIPLDERTAPHQGYIPIRHSKDNYNVRVSVVPSAHGESIVIHILRPGAFQTLDELGFTPDRKQALEQRAFFTRGLLLIAGPTGAGRTTTADVLLNRLNPAARKICTYEEMPELQTEGVEHTYRRNSVNWTLAEAVPALRRQNPDVLFLGDVDDAAAAKIAVETAQTGILVLATMTARDSVDALLRLVGWGIAPRDIANTVTGVVAQYLLPKICRDCRGEGCDDCRKTGRRGRVGVFEVRGMGENERSMLAGRLSSGELRNLPPGKEAGQTDLLEDARAKAEHGIISPDEVNRLSWMLPK